MTTPDQTDGARRRSLLLLGGLGLAAVFALGILALSLWFTGGTPAAPVAPAAAEQTPEAADEDAPAAPAPEASTPEPGTVVRVDGRDVLAADDPFSPVVPDEAAVTAAAGDQPVPADEGAGPTQDPATDVPDEPAPPSAPSPTAWPGCVVDDDVVTCDGDLVALTGLDEGSEGAPVAIIQVGTSMYDVGVGDVFADFYVLLAVNGSCVDVVHPSGGLRLCLDETGLK